jgi:hypothetical protein
MAVCADVYVKEEKNNFFGKPKDKDKPHILDDRQTVTKAYIVFLTSHPDKHGKPSYVNSRQSFTWGGTDKPSNLFKLVKGWFPTGTDEQIRNMSLANLVGKNAWITVEHNKNGYASVTAASTPPPGVQPVAIPADFKRHEQKQAEQPVAVAQSQPVFTQPVPQAVGQAAQYPPHAPVQQAPVQQPAVIGGYDADLPF